MDEQRNNKNNNYLVKALILAIGLFLIWYIGKSFYHIDVDNIRDFFLGLPLFSVAFLYVLLYIVITFFIWFSKDVFWLAGALAFGPVLSAFLVWVAEIINAVILFYIARFLGRGFVEHKLKAKHSRFDERLANLSFGWLFIFRAAPLIPHRFMDLSAGLTGIPFKKYMLAVIFGSPFKIFWIQCVLSGVGKAVFQDSFAMSKYFLKNKYMFTFSFIYVILVILVVIKLIWKRRGNDRKN